MNLRIDPVESWLRSLESFKVPDFAVPDEEVDGESAIDEYLDLRDSQSFERRWTQSCERLNAMLAELPHADHKTLAALQELGREQFYKTIYHQTRHSDLAAYACEDVDIIIGYLALNVADEFTNAMKNAYDNNSFP